MSVSEPPQKAASPILERLAGRARALRKERGLTLRELGEAAGVSERFLVLVEGGSANVSVTKLDDIARALGTTAAALIVPDAGEAEREEGRAATADRAPLVALLGLRGAGKTTVGTLAAKRLGLPFYELDALVAERAGTSLGEIFAMHGAAYYRRLEREELERFLASGAAGVLATGGSLVTDHGSFELLRRSAVTVWLKAKAQDHWARVVAQGDARPMADRSSAMNELRALLRARRALYERAAHVVDTSALGLPRAVDRVVKIAREAASTARS
jgi:XRE family transcriptional regulator, aerobic/anaerobic benzoate catabolism transcriptional regulator